jgi:two-component system sensor histidine kinase CpxA
MKTRFPLSAKILLWFFLNLLLLVAAFFLVLRVQFRFGLDVLISGRGGERIQGLANVLAAELTAQPREEWDDLLQRFGDGYGVQLALVRPDGGHVAGEQLELPREVIERLRERPNPLPPRLNNPGFEAQGDADGAPRRQRFNQPRNSQPDQPERRTLERDAIAPTEPGRNDAPPGQPRLPRPPLAPREDLRDPIPNPPGPPGMPLGRPRFMVRTSQPALYWVGVPLPLPDPQRPQPRLTLLAVSESLRGGGLFFDYTPWLLTAGTVIVLSVAFWLPLVRGITRSLAQLTRATGEIAEGRFDARVPDGRSDELGSLATAVNRMAERLAGFVSGQKRFLGDTAHELCAPIARMQLALGILEQRADEKQKPYVNDVREELQHISSLVNELLSFSKASLRPQTAALQTVNVAEIARRVAERDSKDGDVIEVNMGEEFMVRAEPELLARALANLVRNALRYAGDAGPVRIAAEREGANIVISLQKIFDPFYRLEESRSRDTGGVGLGLAIVKTCVEACDGSVMARNQSPRGFEVRLTLQAA